MKKAAPKKVVKKGPVELNPLQKLFSLELIGGAKM